LTKILSQSGDSLADTYDVEGSIAGIDQLISDDVSLVHEMGSTIFSERVGGQILRLTTGAINQSTAFDIVSVNMPLNVSRIYQTCVVFTTAARLDFVQLSVQNPDGDDEVPFLIWDVNDPVRTIRIVVAGAAAGNQLAVIPFYLNPGLIFGTEQRVASQIPNIVMRGSTAAFGAGTETVVALVYLSNAMRGGLSSRGLPLPGW